VSRALEEKLTAPDKYVNKPWMKFAGALADLHEENVRIAKVIEDEFEQIEPEDRHRTIAPQIPHGTAVSTQCRS
jgi:hypothetical protein